MDIQKYLDLFEYKLRDEADDDSGFWSFKLNAITDNSPEYNKLSDLMRESDLDTFSAYTFTVEALQAMQEMAETGKAFEDGDYSQAPIYNSELVNWMAKGTNWALIDEVMGGYVDFDHNTSIIPVIQLAYSTAWENHYYQVLEAIQ